MKLSSPDEQVTEHFYYSRFDFIPLLLKTWQHNLYLMKGNEYDTVTKECTESLRNLSLLSLTHFYYKVLLIFKYWRNPKVDKEESKASNSTTQGYLIFQNTLKISKYPYSLSLSLPPSFPLSPPTPPPMPFHTYPHFHDFMNCLQIFLVHVQKIWFWRWWHW